MALYKQTFQIEEWNHAGFAEVLNGAPVVAEVSRRLRQLQRKVATYDTRLNRQAEWNIKVRHLNFGVPYGRMGGTLSTGNYPAMLAENKYKLLEKALNGGI